MALLKQLQTKYVQLYPEIETFYKFYLIKVKENFNERYCTNFYTIKKPATSQIISERLFFYKYVS